MVLATLEEAAALAEAGDGIAKAGHGALEGGTAVGARFSEAGLAPAEVARALLRRPGCTAEWIVIKCGADGATLYTRGGDEVCVGSPVVEVGDTVGCGDSAAAAVVLGYLNVVKARRQRAAAMTKQSEDAAAGTGASNDLPASELRALLEETLTLATAVGAATATGTGAGRNVATAEKVRALLDRCVDGGGGGACGFGVNEGAASRARAMLDASLAESSARRCTP